jgi:hypothetical protein
MPKRGIAAVKKGPSKYLTDSSESEEEDIIVIHTTGEENGGFNEQSKPISPPTPQRARSKNKTAGEQRAFTANDPTLAHTLFGGGGETEVRESVEQEHHLEDHHTSAQAPSQAGPFPGSSQQ